MIAYNSFNVKHLAQETRTLDLRLRKLPVPAAAQHRAAITVVRLGRPRNDEPVGLAVPRTRELVLELWMQLLGNQELLWEKVLRMHAERIADYKKPNGRRLGSCVSFQERKCQYSAEPFQHDAPIHIHRGQSPVPSQS